MADNKTFQTSTLATLPSGTVVATDEIGGADYQFIKLVDGTLDSTTKIVAGNGVHGSALRVTLASDSTGTVAVTNAGTFAVQADTELPAAAALADTVANPTVPAVGAFHMGWNGTTWDRVHAGLADSAGNQGLQNVLAMMYNGSSHDRMRGDTTFGLDVDVTRSALPTGASTAAKQPALGTAGSASTDVITIQGIASGTVVPVSGTVTATNSTLSVVGGGAEATALRVTVANDSTGVLSVDDNGASLTVDGTVTAISGTAANLKAEVVGTGTFVVQNDPIAPTTVLMGLKNVTTAGTRVTLAASTACESVTIKARSTNTGIIYVGDTTVASTNGFQLLAGESVSLDIANLNTVNLDSSVNGEGVTYLGVN